MKHAGIIGWPVSHSLSPLLHGHWLKEYGIDGVYQSLPAKPEEFESVIARVRQEGFAGVNVTVPHKEAAFKLAQVRDKASDVCRATNLLLFRQDKLEGRNTDHVGLKLSLEENLGRQALEKKTVVLLGAGGAARAALLALDELSVAQIHILNRHQARADALAHDMALSITAKLMPGPMAAWASVAPTAGLLINSTSAGMTGHDRLELDLSPLAKSAAVCDIVYNPLVTDLLKNAAMRGHQTIDGLGMLMHQAAPSFEAFFGVRPKVTPALRAVLEQALT
jgi:shikimate dehydrogenase